MRGASNVSTFDQSAESPSKIGGDLEALDRGIHVIDSMEVQADACPPGEIWSLVGLTVGEPIGSFAWKNDTMTHK